MEFEEVDGIDDGATTGTNTATPSGLSTTAHTPQAISTGKRGRSDIDKEADDDDATGASKKPRDAQNNDAAHDDEDEDDEQGLDFEEVT